MVALLERNVIGAPTILAKKNAFLKVGGFDTSYQAFEDWEFVIRFARDYQIGFVARPLIDCYVSNSGVSARYGSLYAARCKMLATYKEEMMSAGVFESIMRSILEQAQELGILDTVKKMMMFYLSQ